MSSAQTLAIRSPLILVEWFPFLFISRFTHVLYLPSLKEHQKGNLRRHTGVLNMIKKPAKRLTLLAM